MSKPASRLLALLEILQTRGRVVGTELAALSGVDRRTVRRYIAHLVDMGVPIESYRGCDGGYALRPGYKLPPMMFNADEALALAVGLRAAREIGLGGVTPAISSAQSKLERVMPGSVRRRLRDIDQTVSLDMSRPYAETPNVALLALSAAARAQQRVCMHYRSAGGDETVRDVDVYGVAYRGGAWYAVGHCHLRRDLRSFRLDRVTSVDAVAKSFLRPRDFDVLDHLAHAIATLPRAHSVDVMLYTDLPTARRTIRSELGELTPVGTGVRLLATADDIPWFARELARLPFGFRVIKPAAVRRAVIAHAQELIRHASANTRPARGGP